MLTSVAARIAGLLANLYMRRFILGWKLLGHEESLDAHIVNYADDFVICCRGTAEKAGVIMREMMTRLRLTVNETKTRVCRADEPFNFLGYTIGRFYAVRTGKPYLGVKPSAKKIQGLCLEIHEQTERRWLWLSEAALIARLNRVVRGWANYFRLGTVTAAYRRVTAYLHFRVRQWLVRKHKQRGPCLKQYTADYLQAALGLYRLERLRCPPGFS
jgi:hypothetical protein